MRKMLFGLLLLTAFLIGINVNAKYHSYESGDTVLINNQEYVVIKDKEIH